MVYRLLVIDIDGTLLRSNQRIDRSVRSAIEYVKRKGVYVTLASRRHFASVKKVAKGLKLDAIFISHNGAFVADEIESPLSEHRIPTSIVDDITKYLENNHCHVRIKHERFSLANRIKQNQEMIAKMTIGDPLFYPIHFTDELHDYVNKSPIAPLQIEAFPRSQAEGEVIHDSLSQRFPEIDPFLYADGRLEIVARHVTKGRALVKLAQHLQISEKEIVAVGDSEADISMIQVAGLGVAMGNAPTGVKSCADWVTRSNDQNGLSYMIREVFRKQMRMQIHSREVFNRHR